MIYDELLLESLDITAYALKRLRAPIQMITDHLLKLMKCPNKTEPK